MSSSVTIIVLVLGFCISEAVNEININGDIHHYEPPFLKNFEEADTTCREMNAALPVIKSVQELSDIQDIILKHQTDANRMSIWLNAHWNGIQLVWALDGTPVDPRIVPINNNQRCPTGCCRLIYNPQTSTATIIECYAGTIHTVMCVKRLGSQLQSALRVTQSKANALQKENQSLREDVNSLKSGRIALFVLVGLLMVAVIVFVVGAVKLYKKIKDYSH